MTNQEAFNKVWQTFIVDKAPRSLRTKSNGNSVCSYGEPGTVGCAVACLLAPSERILAWDFENSRMGSGPYCEDEPSGVFELINKALPEDNSLEGVDISLLSALQSWHDSNPVLQAPNSIGLLRGIAISYKLNIP